MTRDVPQRGERWVATAAGAIVLALVIFLLVRNEPFHDPNLVVLSRIVLSLSVAIFGATLPGFLDVEWKLKGILIRAGGALALFVVSLFAQPYVIQRPSDDRGAAEEYNQGVTAYQLGHYQDAIAHLSSIDGESHLYRDAIGLKGNAHLEIGQYDAALTAFREAERVSRNRREKLQARYNLGLTYLYAKDYAEAKRILVPLAETAEMRDDPAVIYNAAAALNLAGDPVQAQALFARFPMSSHVPADASSRDIFAKAHWLSASFAVKRSPPDCEKVRQEIASAEAIAPYLTKDITDDRPLDRCRRER